MDEVVCAIPDYRNQKLCRVALRYAEVYRGPEENVLERYVLAAQEFKADIIMRVTGDCPLIVPELCGEVLAALKREGASYASNIDPRTFPKGLDCEVFTMPVLMEVWRLTKRFDFFEESIEHVTPYMRETCSKRVNVVNPWPDVWPPDGRLTLDTEDDYRTICAAFGHEPHRCSLAA